MTKEAIARQYFMDFLDCLYEYDVDYDEYSEEEFLRIVVDLFFAGDLKIKWNSDKHTLMLKPLVGAREGD